MQFSFFMSSDPHCVFRSSVVPLGVSQVGDGPQLYAMPVLTPKEAAAVPLHSSFRWVRAGWSSQALHSSSRAELEPLGRLPFPICSLLGLAECWPAQLTRNSCWLLSAAVAPLWGLWEPAWDMFSASACSPQQQRFENDSSECGQGAVPQRARSC